MKNCNCESCEYNNNAEWNERTCPMKFVGMCPEEKENEISFNINSAEMVRDYRKR